MPRVDRRAWRTLYERDIDLILLDFLHSSETFRSRLLSEVLPEVIPHLKECSFQGAWHSVIDSLGHESDIEADWWSPQLGSITLLIEDKIDAPCQPDQAERYIKRAERYVQDRSTQVTRTILVAPRGYPLRHKDDTAPFQAHVSLEQIADWLGSLALGERGTYLTDLLTHALGRWARFDSAEGDNRRGRQFPDIYAVLAEELEQLQPNLRISNNPSAQNGWVYLQSGNRGQGVAMRYRFLDQWAELVLSEKAHTEEGLHLMLTAHPLPGASISGRGKTELAVWIPTPELDVEADAASQRTLIRATVGTLGSLQSWYERNLWRTREHSPSQQTLA